MISFNLDLYINKHNCNIDNNNEDSTNKISIVVVVVLHNNDNNNEDSTNEISIVVVVVLHNNLLRRVVKSTTTTAGLLLQKNNVRKLGSLTRYNRVSVTKVTNLVQVSNKDV